MLKDSSKRKQLIGGLVLLGLSLFLATIGTILTIVINSDISLSETILPSIWDLLLAFMQFVFYWICIFLFVSGVLEKGIRGFSPLWIWFLGSSFVRAFGNMLVSYFMNMDSFDSDTFIENVFYSSQEILMDIGFFLLIFLILYLTIIRKSTEKNENFQSLSLFKKPFSVINLAVLLSVLIPSLFRVISRIRYDIFFGAPQNSADIIWMIIYYLLDVLMLLVGYLIVISLLNRLHKCFGKDYETYDESPL